MQYVCARIIRMDDVDIALFERDWNNTLYYFIMNADEHIYMRYGGRDSRGPTTYLDLDSLELTLTRGLQLHDQYKKGEIKKATPPKPAFPREIPPLVERTLARNQCVECHLIGDFQLQYREQQGKLDKVSEMYRWPDIRTIGIELDVPKGLVVKASSAAVQAAGMAPGDQLTALNGTPIYTFGDLQYRYGNLPRDSRQVGFTVEREHRSIELKVTLPERWWLSDLTFRHLSVDPRAEFETRQLSPAEKAQHNLNAESFAGQITRIGGFADMLKMHELKVGDIVASVDGQDHDDLANSPELFIKLRRKAGDSVMLDVIRDGKRLKLPVRTERMYFRK